MRENRYPEGRREAADHVGSAMGRDRNRQNRKRRKREERRSLFRAFLLFWALILVFYGLIHGVQAFIRQTWQGGNGGTSSARSFLAGSSSSFSDEYPDSLVQMARDNPETEDFVRNYLKLKDKKGKIRLTDEDLTGNMGSRVPLFLQWDERWGYRQYGENYLAITGCGPTCLSMVACGLQGMSRWNPYRVAKMAEKSGFYVEGAGSAWDLMTDGAAQMGLQGQELSLDKDAVVNALQSGGIIISVMRPGDFTTSGHFLVMAGIAADGNIIVNDPNSRKRSEKSWNLDKLLPQIKNLWVYY